MGSLIRKFFTYSATPKSVDYRAIPVERSWLETDMSGQVVARVEFRRCPHTGTTLRVRHPVASCGDDC